MKRNRTWKTVLGILLIAFIGIQFIRPHIPNPPATGRPDVPADVEAVLRKACYDCHSNEVHLAWFDQISPAIWLVANDIRDARKVLNFSAWDSLPKDQQNAKLFECLNQATFKEMPLPQYVMLHPSARLTNEDLAVLNRYLSTQFISARPDSHKVAVANAQYAAWQPSETGKNIPPAPNGIAFLPEYKNWEPISTTQRLDNGTMRIITGNDVAVKAIREGHTNPWPDGATFAKIAWDELVDSAGNITTGEFKQVEFMIKDSRKYAATKGWGWARWKGMQLKPYGKNELFTMECVNCHQPMKDNDFVFTTPLQLSNK
ncbi:heme-binding domain-containing protein [Chitinophaga arvensicola]|uniref:Cytochrome P460 n=1 Tax=Chitinophaga arvensicola TaxID=29529 RepID=A0A1I0S590_9BACT|nr:heme-binding domain-containing protein [Chitinophaga arvensicola]SEW50096.1 Cytochrome P460 [Chitinophaga arvensicola]